MTVTQPSNVETDFPAGWIPGLLLAGLFVSGPIDLLLGQKLFGAEMLPENGGHGGKRPRPGWLVVAETPGVFAAIKLHTIIIIY